MATADDRPPRHLYRIDLASPARSGELGPGPVGVDIRPPQREDVGALAVLILDAYRGTIDDEGEDYDDAVAVIEEFFDEAPILDASRVALAAGRPVSALLVCVVRGSPFIRTVFTDPGHKRSGLARRLVVEALTELRDRGETEIRFGIAEGNVPSERLFVSLGAVRLEP